MFNFNFFKSAPAETESQEKTWDPNTVAMQQPSSPAAPSTDKGVVSEQPVCHPPSSPSTGSTRVVHMKQANDVQTGQEQMQMHLRGGGGGGICCGM